MPSYHGDPKIKAKYLARVAEHLRLDQLVPGATGQGGKGCSVYCTFDVYDHSRGPVEIGVPIELMRLNDSIFEALARNGEDWRTWPTRFLSAIPEGRDLSLVWPRFALWMLRGLPPQKRPDVKAAVEGASALYAEWIGGSNPSVERWRKARAAAADAARRTFWAAASAELLRLLASAPAGAAP